MTSQIAIQDKAVATLCKALAHTGRKQQAVVIVTCRARFFREMFALCPAMKSNLCGQLWQDCIDMAQLYTMAEAA